ncbi:DNA mismatch repair endonuclease MutL [Persicobacter psychrovividus]|uniref:DNA mismatch repair protein MutL n=1 Tax=Persicobacter psychrovividus TaxID=387638 RepID=A0ABN6L9W7_9BACT|nr:DNA mismatch repair protein MutL [Persicobacter psychrovividus]
MSDIIKLLPDALANQIAAGEVVQRPASVVKELVENAIDAHATAIQVIVKNAGKSLIQIIDNGNGMSPSDARMSFERHATSKITSSEDLFSIRTMGFRGEAIASIAAVSQVELKTRQAEDEVGTLIINEGAEFKEQTPVATAVGTSFAIKNLFFNVPARRKFLKSNQVEQKHIIEDFQRLALAHPDVAFSLNLNEREIFKLPRTKLSQRIVNIFGKNYRSQMVPMEEEVPHLKVSGYVGKPEGAKKTRGEQFIFVNNRFIKSSYLNHAITNAYDGLLNKDTYPFYVIFLEMDPEQIDINVHPTKTEIKFDDEKTVYAILQATVRQAIGAHHLAPALDFDSNVNFTPLLNIDLNPEELDKEMISTKGQDDTPVIPREEPKTFLKGFSSAASPSSEQADVFRPSPGKSQQWEQMFEQSDNTPSTYQPTTGRSENTDNNFETRTFQSRGQEQTGAITFESAANQLRKKDRLSSEFFNTEDSLSPFQVLNQFIGLPSKTGLMLIDQQAAHERILYEKYAATLVTKTGSSQQFLFPQSIQLNAADYNLVMDLEDEIRYLGFDFELREQNMISLNGIPCDCNTHGSGEQALFEGLLEQYKQNQQDLSLNRQDNIARAIARRSAIKNGTKLTIEEMRNLLEQLFACANPNYAPNGQKTYTVLDGDRMAGFFK